MQAVKNVFPRALLQWEDFKKANAFRLLGRYAGRLPSFNDDIQGTSAVTLAGILSGLRLIGQPLREQRFLLAGSGAAGVGIGRLLRTALLADGLTEAEVRQRQIFIDSGGLVWEGRSDLEEHKREVALRKDELAAVGLSSPPPDSLEKIIRAVRPTVLIGTTGQPGDFTPAAIRAMADHCERPIIFPLSNPTSKAECTPSEALQHSDGRALVATGSPFDPVMYQRAQARHRPVQQRLCVPGRRPGRAHQRGQPRHRFHVPGRRARPGGIHQHPCGQRQLPLSEPAANSAPPAA